MKYIGIKIVEALPMNADEAAKLNYKTSNESEGYEVTYDDGYKSWCPKSVFERNNNIVVNEELASTAKMMVSSDYKKRFLAEYIQLKNRYNGLINLLTKWDKNELTFTPTCPRDIYGVQISAMKQYLDVLEARATLENININL